MRILTHFVTDFASPLLFAEAAHGVSNSVTHADARVIIQATEKRVSKSDVPYRMTFW